MSEENSQVSDQTEQTAGSQSEKEQYVAKKAFEDVSRDMHKYKSKLKEKDAYTNELEARLKSIEEEKLAEKQQWEELYKKRDSELTELKHEIDERDRTYLEQVKRNALKNELGGKIKDEFLVHADLNGIQFTDSGTVDQDSLLNVANDFRGKYPEVIPTEAATQVTGTASPSNTTVSNSELKPLSQMTHEEKKALLNSPEMQAEYKAKGLL